MRKKDILKLIETGEGYKLEFKETFSSSIGKEVCAFANASGGKIILGVRDDNTIRGCSLNNSEFSRIQDIARNIEPSFNVSIEQVDDLVVIDVSEGKEKPYSVNGHFYIRQGANSQKLRRDEVRGFFQRENLIRFDNKANPDFDIRNDFDREKFKAFVQKLGVDKSLPQKNLLQNLGLVTDGKLNNTGVLFFSHRISKFFLNSVICCVLYDGRTKTKILDKKEYDGDFVSNFNDAVLFVLRNLRTEFVIEKIEREEKEEIPENALRELIINAMAHRDYFSEGRILIEIFSDNVKISNPGSLLFDKKDFGKRSLSRNPLIVDIAHRLKFVERLGSGIERVREILKDRVKFEISSDWFEVIIKRRQIRIIAEETENYRKSSPKVHQKSSPKIIELMRENPNITITELSLIIGITERGIKKNIAKLKQEGIIKRVGSYRAGYWKVLGDNKK